MSKSSDASNTVVYTAVKTCDLYRVKSLRMQSRVMWVPGAAGRPRPMFFGKWTDDFGKEHNGGMADLLARPRVELNRFEDCDCVHGCAPPTPKITVPVWIECKSGKGRMTPDQIAFKNYVEGNGETYILLHDDMRPLTEWFESHGLKEGGR